MSLVACPTALRAQAVGGAGYAPAIASTGSPSGVSGVAPAGTPSSFSNDISPTNGLSQATDRTQVAPPAQSPWTADRTLPDAGQLRPRNSHSGQTAQPRSGSDFSQIAPTSRQANQTGSSAITSQVVTASATGPAADPREMPVASNSAFTETSSGVQHIPLAPPSKRLTGEQPKTSGGTLQMLVSIISSLLLVVGLFLGVAWCYRKTLGTSLAGGLPKQVVNILGRTSISARQQLVLVRFGSKLLLVSVIQGEARTLGEISDPLEVDQMLGLCESGQPGSISQSFKSLLHSEGV